METEIVQNFLGKIDGVEFDDKNVYNSAEFLLENIEAKFGEIYNQKFVRDLRDVITNINDKSDHLIYDDLEKEFLSCIRISSSFQDIFFEYWFGDDLLTRGFNYNISLGFYIDQQKQFIFGGMSR